MLPVHGSKSSKSRSKDLPQRREKQDFLRKLCGKSAAWHIVAVMHSSAGQKGKYSHTTLTDDGEDVFRARSIGAGPKPAKVNFVGGAEGTLKDC